MVGELIACKQLLGGKTIFRVLSSHGNFFYTLRQKKILIITARKLPGSHTMCHIFISNLSMYDDWVHYYLLSSMHFISDPLHSARFHLFGVFPMIRNRWYSLITLLHVWCFAFILLNFFWQQLNWSRIVTCFELLHTQSYLHHICASY